MIDFCECFACLVRDCTNGSKKRSSSFTFNCSLSSIFGVRFSNRILTVIIVVNWYLLNNNINFYSNTGGSPNPARDLSPRILSYFAGWGIQVFRYRIYQTFFVNTQQHDLSTFLLHRFSFRDWTWFWIPVVIPHIGIVIGYLIYFLLIEAHWPAQWRHAILCMLLLTKRGEIKNYVQTQK